MLLHAVRMVIFLPFRHLIFSHNPSKIVETYVFRDAKRLKWEYLSQQWMHNYKDKAFRLLHCPLHSAHIVTPIWT